MATAMGGLGLRVEKNDQFADALAQAKSFDGVSLIEIIVDNQVITPNLTLEDLRNN